MKILYVIEGISTKGGLERIIIDKMNVLSTMPDFDVTLMTVWKDGATLPYPLNKDVEHLSLDIERPHSTFSMLTRMPQVLKRFDREVRRISPDVTIHFRAVGAFLIAFSSWKGRTIFESHCVRHTSPHLWLYPLMEKKVGTIVCLTKGDANEYSRARDIRIVPNFTNIIPKGEPDYQTKHCIFVGRLCKEKDPLRLLRFWMLIHQSQPDWVLDIYGDGPLRQQLEQGIALFQLSESVTLHGQCEDMASAYQHASILLQTSQTESFGLTILEAMTCGLPVVSLDCQYGPAELIEDGVTGYLIPTDGSEVAHTFADATIRLMNDENLRRQMGQKAQEKATLFSRSSVMTQWIDIFKKG